MVVRLAKVNNMKLVRVKNQDNMKRTEMRTLLVTWVTILKTQQLMWLVHHLTKSDPVIMVLFNH